MKQHKDRAIILARINYGERDRILTLLCQQAGRVSVLAKSVRSEKSRLAGGIELLSESEVTFVDTRSNLKTLTSARLRVHFDGLTRDMMRMNQAFGYIRVINGIVDDSAGQEYYSTLLTALVTLNDKSYDAQIVDIWFNLRILKQSGSEPNLRVETTGEIERENFNFDYDHQRFVTDANGQFSRNDLKLLRLCMSQNQPPKLQNRSGSVERLQALTRALLKTNLTEL